MESWTNNAKNAEPAASFDSGKSAPATLSGHLGVLDIVFTVLAYNAPLTVVVAFLPLILSEGNGLGAPVTYLIAGALMLVFAVGFTTMSKHVPNAGAYYAYISAGLGRPFGLGSALMAILAYGFLMVGMYLYAGVVYVSLLEHTLGHSPLRWWQWSLVLCAVVSLLGYLRVSLSAKLLTLALIFEVCLVFAWEGGIAIQNGVSNLAPVWLTPSAVTSGSLGIAILFGVTSFAGFEATAVFREEVRDPEKTVPRATYVSVIVMAFMFSTAAYFLIAGFGPEVVMAQAKSDASAVALNSIGIYLGRAGLQGVNVLLCSSVFACVLSLHNILSRYIYSLSIDGTLPKSWAAVHPRHGSPYKASVIVSMVMFVVLAFVINQSIEPYAGYGVLTGVGGYALLLLQILTSLSVVAFFARKTDAAGLWKTRIAPTVSFFALLGTGWLATSNMEMLTGNARVATILLAFVFGTLLSGVVYAMVLRKLKPNTYSLIGRQKI